MILFLIGYRGCGKTTVAEILARRLSWSWADADAEIERRAGKTIADVFRDDGETAFRDLESAVVAELAQRDESVIALGGGAVMRETTRKTIAQRGKVVWLTASPRELQTRIAGDASTESRRPSLTSQGGLDEIIRLLERREPVYRQCADHTVDTENRSPVQIAEQIVAWLNRSGHVDQHQPDAQARETGDR